MKPILAVLLAAVMAACSPAYAAPKAKPVAAETFLKDKAPIVLESPWGPLVVTREQLMHLFANCFPNVPDVEWTGPDGKKFTLACAVTPVNQGKPV